MAGEYLTPTPYANPLTGLSNDMIQGLLEYMKDKQRTQQMQGLAGLLESTGIPKTVERAAYAESPKALLDSLTNVNRANVPLLKAETADALMNIAPMVGPAARGAERAAMAAGRAGERYAEKVVPQIMEQGGLPAQLLGDLAQGSMSRVAPQSIVREGNPIQSAVVLVGDRMFTGRTHTEAFNRAIYEGAIRKEGNKFIYPKGAEVNSDLFMTKDGQIIDRLQASKMFDIGASETAIKEGLMQNKPPSSMSVDSYIEQAKAIRQQKEKPSFTYPQEEAMRLAQQRAALPVEQGGLGLLENNTAAERAAAMGIKTDAFHGSKQDITGPFKAGYEDNLAFVTQSPEFASKWIGKGKLQSRTGSEAEIKAAEDMYRQIKYKNTDNELLSRLEGEEFNAAYDKMSAAARAEQQKEFGLRGTPSGIHDTVYPVKVQANKTFNPETNIDVMSDYFKDNNIPKSMQELFANGNYMAYENPAVVSYLKSKGFDSMRLRESSGDNFPTIAVFDPETVRSRFAAFDPWRRTSAIAAAMGVAAPDLLAEEQKPKKKKNLLD